eukprot:TRINITY_DN12126_c0_g1_i7.p1 TRINITY_DN12126_c0_g1~~TRINITY_DN12126_c0_g1_i7.p1  ORF type:complete len:528 (+),score=88.55 TRINITY_DN12126_c0_g1_i7:206-1585(+)
MWLVGFVGGEVDGEKDICDKENLASLVNLVNEAENMFKVGLFALPDDEDAKTDASKLLRQIGVDAQLLEKNPCDPQIFLFPFGDEKLETDEFAKFEGDISDTKSVIKWAQSEVPDMTAMIPRGAAEAFLQNSAAIPKIILFTNKESVPDVFKTLAINFREYPVVFSWVSSKDKQTVDLFQIQKFPFIVIAHLAPYEPQEGESQAQAGQMGMALSPYPGPLKYKEMYYFFKMVAQETKDKMEGKTPREDFMTQGQQPVKEVSAQEDFRESCLEAGGICVIGLFDPQVPNFEEYLEILQDVADKRPNDPLRFIWVDAAKQPQFRESFQVSIGQLPTVVAYSGKKDRFGILFATYTEQHIGEMLDGVMRGSVATTPTVSVPSIVDGGVQDDAEGGQEETLVEEEFDLSDIMSEEIEGVKSKEQVFEELDQKLAEEEKQKSSSKKSSKKSKKSKKKKSKKDEL